MFSTYIFIVLSLILCVQAQDPRKRHINPYLINDIDTSDDEIICSAKSCTKRSEDLGPFWANRGKKDPTPTYIREHLYTEEPHWILVRREDEPFLHSRGKKDFESIPEFCKSYNRMQMMQVRDRREYGSSDGDTPFFASRGKKVH